MPIENDELIKIVYGMYMQHNTIVHLQNFGFPLVTIQNSNISPNIKDQTAWRDKWYLAEDERAAPGILQSVTL